MFQPKNAKKVALKKELTLINPNLLRSAVAFTNSFGSMKTRGRLPIKGWTNLKSHLVSYHPGWKDELKKHDGQAEISFIQTASSRGLCSCFSKISLCVFF